MMAYFSNGTEGMAYQDQYCDRCVHDDRATGGEIGGGCIVWTLHLVHSRENPLVCDMLDVLIPMVDSGTTPSYKVAGQCSMFVPKAVE